MAPPPLIAAGVECVWPAAAVLGEGPLWDGQRRCLFWLDIKGRKLHCFTPEGGGRQTWPLPLRVGSLGLPPPGWGVSGAGDDIRFIAGTEAGFAWLALGGAEVGIEAIADPEPHLPFNRFNDGAFGPDGRYYAGTMDDREQEVSGALYALDSTGAVTRLDDGYLVTNGPAFSPDGCLYHADSPRQVIYRIELDGTGKLRSKREFCRFAPDEGFPDGMTCDASGNLWVAVWDGARIECISPEGERKGSVALPTRRITSCVFVGSGERVLYATSAALDGGGNDPLAGGLFRIMLE